MFTLMSNSVKMIDIWTRSQKNISKMYFESAKRNDCGGWYMNITILIYANNVTIVLLLLTRNAEYFRRNKFTLFRFTSRT